MRPDRKKEKMVGYNTNNSNTGPPLAALSPGNGRSGIGSGIGILSSSPMMSGGGGVSGGGGGAAPFCTPTKQEKPSYKACPPPPNLYGPPSSPAAASFAQAAAVPPSYSDKVKTAVLGGGPDLYGAPSTPPNHGGFSYSDKVKIAAGGGGGGSGGGGLLSSSSLTGSWSDGEKKGRRRPGRKSRQNSEANAAASSANSNTDGPVHLGKSSDGSGGAGAVGGGHEPMKQQQHANGTATSHLPSPNPSAMPNPSFKMKPAAASEMMMAPSTKHVEQAGVNVSVSVESSQVSKSGNGSVQQSEIGVSSSSSPSWAIASGVSLSDISSCIIDQKSKDHHHPLSVGVSIPKPKLKDPSSKVSKSNKVPSSSAKKSSSSSSSLGIDPKQALQKGWRACTPPGHAAAAAAASSSSLASSPDDTVPLREMNQASGAKVGSSNGTSGASFSRKEAAAASSSDRTSTEGCSSSQNATHQHSWPEQGILAKPANGGHSGSGGAHSHGHGHAYRPSSLGEHISREDAEHLIEVGLAFKGFMRVNPHYRSEAYVTLEGVPVDILIDGQRAQNRAMEGDEVAVQLNHASLWPPLKGTNNKQSYPSGTDDLNVRVGKGSSENEIIDVYEDTVVGLDIESVGPAATATAKATDTWTTVGNWDSLGAVTVSESDNNNNKVALAALSFEASNGSLLSSSSSELHRRASAANGGTNSDDPPEVPRQGSSELAISGSSKSSDKNNSNIRGVHLAKLAALVESMPGKRPTGIVIAILGHSMRRDAVVGFLEAHWKLNSESSGNTSSPSPQKGGKKQQQQGAKIGGGVFTFVPVDSRFSKMVVYANSIPEPLIKRIKEGDPTVSSELLVAQIEGWKAENPLPRASVKQTLGPGGTIEAQTEAILLENAIHGADFLPECIACLPTTVPWSIPEDEVKKRRDFRGIRVFTIDPPTARDLDDALSIEQMGDGIIRIGVHIADVSFFVHPDTALDKEAQSRSTSIYLNQKVLPMLPPRLCEELCSLNPGVDRLAFSVLWSMDRAGNLVDQWIGKTIIRSCAKLTYGQAQGMIDGTVGENGKGLGFEGGLDEDGGEAEEEVVVVGGGRGGGLSLPQLHGEHKWAEIKSDVRKLHEVAKRRRENRFEGGALKLESSQLVFSMDEEGEPCDSTMYQHQDSNFLVEEFMLLANMTVAKVISSAFPERSLLRRHPEPNGRKMKEFEEFCTKNGFELDPSSSGALHLSLERMREKYQDDPELFSILMLYATKPMQLAKYFCTGDLKDQEEAWSHYALAAPLYTHFTSPIRRYPDLVVHRLMAATLEAEKAITSGGSSLSSSSKKKKKNTSTSTGHTSEPPSQFFSGAVLDKDAIATDSAQKALTMAAEKHKIPELSELSSVASHCNERRLAGRNVKEASDKLYLWSMLKKKQGMLSNARVLAVGPKFMTLYVSKVGLERRIYYDEVEGLTAEWLEAMGTVILSLVSDKGLHNNNKRYGPQTGGRIRPRRALADVALIVSPIDMVSEKESSEDLIREIEDRFAGKSSSGTEEAEDDANPPEEDQKDSSSGSHTEIEPEVFPLTLRWFSSLPVSIHAVGGENRPLDIAVRLYVSSYLA